MGIISGTRHSRNCLSSPLSQEKHRVVDASCPVTLAVTLGGGGGDLGEEHKQYLKGMHGFLGSSAIERII